MALCYKCFKEYEGEGRCSHCGYSPADDAGKYPLALKAGTILDGRYIVGRVLGQGGFGITYSALEYDTKKLLAIKEYFPERLAGRSGSKLSLFSAQHSGDFEYGKQNFLAEAETLSQFKQQSNVCDIYSYFEENGTAYFAMEYVEGIPLDKYMNTKGGRLGFDEALQLLLPVMAALGKIHAKGIIHRDISPDNIMVKADGGVVLIDFGAARYSMGEKSRSLDVVLKHGFAPREQYARHGRQGAYTDVYAMAATIYYAISGKVPPDAIDRVEEDLIIAPSSMGIRMPAAAEDALLKALSLSPADRFSSMEAFAAALCGGKTVKKPEKPKPTEEKKPAQESKTTQLLKNPQLKKLLIPAVAAVAALVLLIGMGGDKEEERVLNTTEPVATEVPQEISWEFDKNSGTLTISGSGPMEDFESYKERPWGDYEITSNTKCIIIGEGITHIGDYAFFSFHDISTHTLILPDSLESIGDAAFRSCKYLEDFKIPSNLKSLGKQCFADCGELTVIELPEGFETLNSSAFSNCHALKKVSFPSSIKLIDTMAFENCSRLTTLEFAENCPELVLGSSVFRSCDALRDVKLPEGLSELSFRTFENCDGLKKLSLPGSLDIIAGDALAGCGSLAEVHFNGSEQLWDMVEIREGNDSLDSAALFFEGGAAQRAVSIVASGDESNINWQLDDEGVLHIKGRGDMADYEENSNHAPWWDYVKQIVGVEMDDSITGLGEYAFAGCENLVSVKLSKNLTKLGTMAFYNCLSLTEVQLPTGASKVNSLFYGCENLKTVSIPEGVETIGGYTFFRCKNLETLYLPGTLKKVEPYAFNGCNSLENVYFNGTYEQFSELYVPIEGNSPIYDNYINILK